MILPQNYINFNKYEKKALHTAALRKGKNVNKRYRVTSKNQGHSGQCCRKICMYCISPTTDLMTNLTGSTLPPVSPSLSHSHTGVDSHLTHIHNTRTSVRLTMSEVAASRPGDRWGWQMLLSERATERYQTSSLSNPPTSHIRFITLHFLSHNAGDRHHVTWRKLCLHLKYLVLFVKI